MMTMDYNKLFGVFGGQLVQYEMDRPSLTCHENRKGRSFCETCQAVKPNHGIKVFKGWKCDDCKDQH